MADSSRTQLYYLKEAAWGVTPSAPMTELRFTGESLGYRIANSVSNEVRSDRQVVDLIQTGAQAAGGIEFELSRGACDDLAESALYAAWTSAVDIDATDISAAASDNSYNAATTDFAAAGVLPGQWVRVSGFATAANNGFARVVSAAARKLVVAGPTLADEASGATVAIDGSILRNGTSETSFTLEKKFGDIGQHIVFRGMVADSMNLSIEAGAVLTGGFEFAGKSAAIAQATAGSGQPAAAAAGPVMNAASDVGNVLEGGKPLAGTFLQSLSIALSNGVRGIGAVGTLGNADLGAGRCAVTGNVSVYFADAALYDKYLAGAATSLSFRVSDASGAAYAFTLPRVKFTDGSIAAGGADRDVMAEFAYQALRDPATGCTIQIDRFPA